MQCSSKVVEEQPCITIFLLLLFNVFHLNTLPSLIFFPKCALENILIDVTGTI